MLPAFAQQHPHVKIAAVQKRNRFPLVKAEYGEWAAGCGDPGFELPAWPANKRCCVSPASGYPSSTCS